MKEHNLSHKCDETQVTERKKKLAYTARDIAKHAVEIVRSDPFIIPDVIVQAAKQMPGHPDVDYHTAHITLEFPSEK